MQRHPEGFPHSLGQEPTLGSIAGQRPSASKPDASLFSIGCAAREMLLIETSE